MECTMWSKIRYVSFIFSFWQTNFTHTHQFLLVCVLVCLVFFNLTNNLLNFREGYQNELTIIPLIIFAWHPLKSSCKSEANLDVHFLFIFRQAGLSA